MQPLREIRGMTYTHCNVSVVSINVNYQNIIAMTELPVPILLTRVDLKIPRTALWDSFGDFKTNQMTFFF